MASRFSKVVHIAAGAQLLGTELKASTGKDMGLRPTEILLKMGTESKTWKIYKTWTAADGSTIIKSILKQSTDDNGAPAANTVADVVLTGADIGVVLSAGEQIQAETSGATAAIELYVQYEEIDLSKTRRQYDPARTR